MKHYLDLVSISAKVHRKQSYMSVFCIILAVFLVTTIFGMADMFIRSQILQTQKETGNFHIAIRDITNEEITLISKRPDVKVTARYHVLNFRGNEGYTLSDKNAIIAGCDETWATKMFVDSIAEGYFPKTATEAMLTENAKNQLNLQIGDTITIDAPNGKKLHYTISGFCHNASKIMLEDCYGVMISTDAFHTIYSDIKNEKLENNNDILYVQFENPLQIQKAINNLKAQFHLSDEQISENTKLLSLLGQSTNSFMLQIYSAAFVLFLLVLIAGIFMIASSLNSNVAQRTEFFGLMRCMGATPKQVMKFVQKEALRWCRFAIPIGICMGMIVIWILCAILRILSPEYFMEMPIFGISIPSIITGMMVGLLTVLFAARSPASKAAKVSPLTAVSGHVNDFLPAKKTTNIKLCKIETALGIHHAKASKKNLLLMTGSFAFSIILFLSFSVTIDFMHHALTTLRPWTADISIISHDNTCTVNRTFLEHLQDNSVVKSAYGRMFAYDVPVTANDTEKKIDLISYEQNQFHWAEEYLLDGSIANVQNEVNTGLIVYEPQNTIEIGDTVIMHIDGQPKEIKIVGMLSSCPFNNAIDVGTVICSENTFQQIVGTSNYTIIDVQLTKKATDSDVHAIRQMVGSDFHFSDKRMENSNTLGTYYCFVLFVYGFLVLIALITIFNIINSIAMSVSARTKQYGTFRAIGLSTYQLTKMVIAEASTYTILGSIIGTIFGLICNKVLFNMLVSSHWGNPWTVPYTELLIIVWIMLFSVILAVYEPIKRIRHMPIVDIIHAQ